MSGSTDVLHTEIDASNLAGLGERSAVVASGQVNLNWRASRDDAVQLGGQAQARRLTAQGYVGGAAFANFGWRHTFSDRLAATLTATDPFGLARRTIAVETPTLTEIDKRKYRDSAVPRPGGPGGGPRRPRSCSPQPSPPATTEAPPASERAFWLLRLASTPRRSGA